MFEPQLHVSAPSSRNMNKEFLDSLENIKEVYWMSRKDANQRNKQIDALTIHLLAVSFGEILNTTPEQHIQMRLPIKIFGIYVMHIGGLLASRGFVTYGKIEGNDDWIMATLQHMKRDDLITDIAVALNVEEEEEEEKEVVNVERKEEHTQEGLDRVQMLERELLHTREALSRLKRQRNGVMEVPSTHKKIRGISHGFHRTHP